MRIVVADGNRATRYGVGVALREHGPTPLHRQSFAPVWMSTVPQEQFAFMLEEEFTTEEHSSILIEENA